MSSERVITLCGLYVLKQNETGVCLTLGKFSATVSPGLGFAIPFIQQVRKTVSSLQTIDLPDQQIVLSGNISVTISGNLNFRVANPERALLAVADYRYTMQQLALTTISDVLGTKSIEEIRSSKTRIADEIEKLIAKHATEWGIGSVDIRLTDARLDDNLQRAMMRETEAQKEASAIKIKAESDRFVATIFADAARTLATSPGAMTLRILQTLSDVSSDKTTIVIPIPIDLLSRPSGDGASTALAPEVVTSDIRHAKNTSDGVSFASIAELPVPIATPNSMDEFPIATLKLLGSRTTAICPKCQAKYDITEILGNLKYDQRPDIPGQQARCRQCQVIFSIPETT